MARKKSGIKKFIKSRGFRLILILVLAVLAVIGCVCVINNLKEVVSVTYMDELAGDDFVFNGNGIITYQNGYFNYYDLKSEKKNKSEYIGAADDQVRIAAGSEIEIVYTDISFRIVRLKRNIEVDGIIEGCSCGGNFAAFYILGMNGNHRIEIYNASGDLLRSKEYPSSVITSFGFESYDSTVFYTAELMTVGQDLTTTITTYDLGRNSINGLLSVQGMIVGKLFFTEKSIFAIGTKQLIRYDRITNKEIYRVLIYGYDCSSAAVSGSNVIFALTAAGTESPAVVKLLSVKESDTASDTFVTVSIEPGSYFGMLNGRLYTIKGSCIRKYASDGSIDGSTSIEGSIDAAYFLSDRYMLVHTEMGYRLLKAK